MEDNNVKKEGKFSSKIWFFIKFAIAAGIILAMIHSQLGSKSITVEKDSTLKEISALPDVYGSENSYLKLYDANKNSLKSPDAVIPAGTVINIPGRYSDIPAMLKKLDTFWLALAVLIYISHLLVGAYRWKLLLKTQDIDMPFRESFSLCIQGFFFSLVIPGGSLGGDLVKAGRLAARSEKGKRLEGAFSILMDRFTGMIALFSLTAVLAAVYFKDLMKLKGMMGILVGIILIACLAGLGSVFVVCFHRTLEKIKPIGWVMSLGDKYSGGKVSRLTNALDLYKNSYKTLIICVVMSIFFVHANVAMCAFCIAKSLGVQDASPVNMVLSIGIANTAGLIPLTPAGLGTRDAVLKELLTNTGGFSGEQAITLALLYSSIIVAVNIFGGLFFILDRGRKVSGSSPPKQEE